MAAGTTCCSSRVESRDGGPVLTSRSRRRSMRQHPPSHMGSRASGRGATLSTPRGALSRWPRWCPRSYRWRIVWRMRSTRGGAGRRTKGRPGLRGEWTGIRARRRRGTARARARRWARPRVRSATWIRCVHRQSSRDEVGGATCLRTARSRRCCGHCRAPFGWGRLCTRRLSSRFKRPGAL